MSTNRKAPFTHPDGSNCWTRNCRLGHKQQQLSEKEKFMQDMLAHHKTVTNEPTPTIDLIAPLEVFQKAVNDSRITGQHHPEYPYVIYKYSQLTTYSKDWDEVTLASRGLVVNEETGEIVARPFKKFFNYEENQTPPELLTGRFVVADKLDGSLGLLYRNPAGDYEITTAGGFQSEQAAHATELYNKQYAGNWKPNPNLTYHYEIIYPGNRIVVDYGEEDDIYLLGAVNKRTGRSVPLERLTEWKWKRAEEFDNFSSLKDVRNAPDPGISHEGYVVHFVKTDTRVKFKFSEYLQVHKIATGINSRRIHEELREGGARLEEFKMNAPEEFKEYIDSETTKLTNQYNTRRETIINTFNQLKTFLPENADRKTFALTVKKHVDKSMFSHMFNMLDRGEPVDKLIWDSIEPPFEKGFFGSQVGKNQQE